MKVLCYLHLCRHRCAVCGKRYSMRGSQPWVSFTAHGQATYVWYGHKRCTDAVRSVLNLGPGVREDLKHPTPAVSSVAGQDGGGV